MGRGQVVGQVECRGLHRGIVAIRLGQGEARRLGQGKARWDGMKQASGPPMTPAMTSSGLVVFCRVPVAVCRVAPAHQTSQ